MSTSLPALHNRALRFLTLRPRTKKEVIDYLKRKQEIYRCTDDEVSEEILRLESLGYVDDVAFVDWFVNSRISSKPKSISFIKNELRILGVSPITIDNHFENTDIDELELAMRALSKRVRIYAHLPEKQMIEKSILYLLRRGFTYDTSKKAVANIHQ